MSWEKLPFLGAAAAVLLTAALVRMIFVVPEYNGFGWDISFYVILPVLDVYLVGYKDSRYWKPFGYAVFPGRKRDDFAFVFLTIPEALFCELSLGIDFKYILCYTYNVI